MLGILTFTFGNFSGIFGICTVKNKRKEEETFLLVVDPHFWKSPKTQNQPQNEPQKMRQMLSEEKWVEWKSLKEFMKNSFYNLCLPQIKRNKPDTV